MERIKRKVVAIVLKSVVWSVGFIYMPQLDGRVILIYNDCDARSACGMFHINKTLATSQESRIFLKGTDIKELLHVYSNYTTVEDRIGYRAEKS